MRNWLTFFCVFAVCAVLLVWTCSKPTGVGDNGDTGNNQTYSYTVSGNNLIISIPQQIFSYCDSTVMIHDTMQAMNDTMHYNVTGDTLTLIQNSSSMVFYRSGSGSGLIGTWTLNDTAYSIQLVFTATTVTATTTYCYADEWMSYDWAYDSAYYNVTAVKLSCTSVRLTGDSTHEQVTITWNSNGDMTVTSSNAGHSAHTYYQNPTSCPNDYYPDWYYSGFLDLNPKNTPAAKRAVKPFVPRVKKHSIFR